DQPLAELVVGLARGEPEARPLVDVARGQEQGLRPEDHLAVAGAAGEAEALADQPRAEARAARARLDQEQAELRHRPRARHEEDGAHPLAVALRDPGALAAG